jgi:hypothetical protein
LSLTSHTLGYAVWFQSAERLEMGFA